MRKPLHRVRRIAVSAVCAATLACAAVPAIANAADAQLVNWTKLFGESGTSTIATTADSVNDTQRLVGNGFVAVGAFDGAKSDDAAIKANKTDATISRSAADGTLQWQKTFGGTKTDAFSAVIDVTDLNADNPDADHAGFVAVGYAQSNDGDLDGLNKGGYDGVIAKFDADGNLVKAVTFGGGDKDELTDVVPALDGGYVVSGYANSADGDLSSTGKSTGPDAIVAKYSADLELQWVTAVGGTQADGTEQERFTKVVALPGATAKDADGNEYQVAEGYVAVGYSNVTDGDYAKADGGTINRGGYDAVVAKFDAAGAKQSVKTYGGTGDDKALDIARAALLKESDNPFDRPSVYDNGFTVVGATDSPDGNFGAKKETPGSDSEDGVESGFVLRLDSNTAFTWGNVIEDSGDVTADAIVAVEEGYLVAGSHSKNDIDFTGTDALDGTSANNTDLYVAHFAENGARLTVTSLGGYEREVVKSFKAGGSSDFLVAGNTRSNDKYFTGMQGKMDGFVMSLDAERLLTHADEKTLVPVTALHATLDQPSMMAPMLYKDAYVERTGEQYQVTVYFIPATIMGSQVNPSILGDVSYEFEGSMIDAVQDSYDSVTHVKSATIVLRSLQDPVLIHIENAMGDIRLSFDPSKAVETDTPPYFEPVKVTVPNFEADWKAVIGGSDAEYSADLAVLKNGNLVSVGQTYSFDGDFQNIMNGPSTGFVNIRTQDGTPVKTFTIGGMENNFVSYAAGVTAMSDGGYTVVGSYTLPGEGARPTGDFAPLDKEGAVFGGYDGYVARYDASDKLVWMQGFSGSSHDQVRMAKETADGGVVALVETVSSDGDMAGLQHGLFDVVLVKYGADGERQWVRSIGGKNLESSDMGLAILSDGNFIVTGITSSYDGDFTGVDYFGSTFDLFSAKVSSADGSIQWVKTYGGSNNEYLNGVTATSDGGFVMVGQTKSTDHTFAEVGTGMDNSYVMKLDAEGAVQWVDMIKSTEANEAQRVIETPEGYVVVGDSSGTDYDFKDISKGGADAYVATYDKQGARISLKTIGGTLADYSSQIIQLNDTQLTAFVYGQSSDGDFEGLARGSFDSMLLTYTFREAPVDKAALEELVAKAEGLAAGDYTEASWKGLAEPLAAAKAVVSNEAATQPEVDKAKADLQAAIDALVPVFSDVDYAAWYAPGVQFAFDRGLMTGYAGTERPTFGVGNPTTRAEFAVTLWRYANPTEAAERDRAFAKAGTLPDIEPGQFYTEAANWAVENGVINGVEEADGSRAFHPNDPVTTEQMVAILANLTVKDGAVDAVDPSVLEKFVDRDGISSWATQSVAWGAQVGIINGFDEPNGRFVYAIDPILRERMATIFMNAFEIGLMK